MNKKFTKNKKNLLIAFIAILIFFLSAYFVLKFPIREQQNKLELIGLESSNLNGLSWDNYEELDKINPSLDYNFFSTLNESEKNALNKNFLSKIQKCLSLNLTNELETQLIYNLGQGASREAVLRGLLSKQEVFEMIELNSTDLLSEEIILYIGEFNRKFLQRDDFELPIDMRLYELKVALMEEFLDVAEKHLNTDTRKFYLWSAYILHHTLDKFRTPKNNQELALIVSKIPTDHLKTEVPLAICQTIDRFAEKSSSKKVIQNP